MDILVERTFRAAPAEVACVMFEPENDPRWIRGAKAVQRLTAGPIAVGSRVRRDGGFLGRRFFWVTEVVELQPARRLAMRFVEGPMKGGVDYGIEPDAEGSRISIRNHGGASFSVPGMAWMLRQSVAKDLERLERLVEAGPRAPDQ